MRALHIEADQQHPARSPLNRQVQSLKAAIAAAPNDASLKRKIVRIAVSPALPALGYPDAQQAVKSRPVAIPANLEAVEFRKPTPMRPPCAVAAIDRIGPRREIDRFLDDQNLGAALQNFEICRLGRWPRSDDGNDMAGPIRPD